jgi:hypothetical protein
MVVWANGMNELRAGVKHRDCLPCPDPALTLPCPALQYLTAIVWLWCLGPVGTAEHAVLFLPVDEHELGPGGLLPPFQLAHVERRHLDADHRGADVAVDARHDATVTVALNQGAQVLEQLCQHRAEVRVSQVFDQAIRRFQQFFGRDFAAK